jgi:hypothetical protein
MSETNSDNKIFSKDPLSMEGEFSRATGDVLKDTSHEVDKSTNSKINSLADLDKDTALALLEKKANIETRISRDNAEATIKPGIYDEDGETYIVVPKSFCEEDSVIGAMIYDLSTIVGFKLKVLETTTEITKLYDEDFVSGLWFGFFTSVALKRKRSKKSYELGRACAFSLIVKSVFAETQCLGPAALCKDNFFFGNKPEETHDKSRVPFYVKMKLRSFFVEPEYGDLVLGILNRVARTLGVSYLTESESDKMISDNLVPIDQLITSCYPTVKISKGKRTEEKVKKPNAIRTSPLYLKEEMELLRSITQPLFSDMKSLVDNYEQSVFVKGFDGVKSHIQDSINTRWETLQRFANRTKIRLQDIRKITGDGTKKKANIKTVDVTALLDNSTDCAGRLVKEIKHIVGNNNIIEILTATHGTVHQSPSDAWASIHLAAFKIYENLKPTLKNEVPKDRVLEPLDLTTDYTKAFETLAKLQNNNGELIKNMNLAISTRYFKLFGRFRKINELIKSCNNLFKICQRLDRDAVDIAVRLYHENLYKDRMELNDNYNRTFKETLDKLETNLDRALKFESHIAAKTALQKFIEEIPMIRDTWSIYIYNT